MSCPCPCGCGPAATCRCVEDNCPCATWGADIWHTPKLLYQEQTPYAPLYVGACCVCAWASAGAVTEERAWEAARRHAKISNAAMFEEMMAGELHPDIAGPNQGSSR